MKWAKMWQKRMMESIANQIFRKRCYNNRGVGINIYRNNTKKGEKEMNSINPRFKTLSMTGTVISTIGRVQVVFSVMLAGGGVLVTMLMQLLDNESNAFIIGVAGVILGVLAAVGGILYVAFGQVISCFVSTEDNTHATDEKIQALIVVQQEMLQIMKKQSTMSDVAAEPKMTDSITDKKE